MSLPTNQTCPRCKRQAYTAKPFCEHCRNLYPPLRPSDFPTPFPPAYRQRPPEEGRTSAAKRQEPDAAKQAPVQTLSLPWRDLPGDLKYQIVLMWAGCISASLWALAFALTGHADLSAQTGIFTLVSVFVALSVQSQPIALARIHGRIVLGVFAWALVLLVLGIVRH